MPETLIWRSCFCVLHLFQVLKQVCGAWSPHGALASFWAITAPALLQTTSFRICCCLFHDGLMATASAQRWVSGSSLPPQLPLLPGLCCSIQALNYSVQKQLQQQRQVMGCAAMNTEQRGVSQACAHKTLVVLLWTPSLLFQSVGVSSLRLFQKMQHVNKAIDALQRSLCYAIRHSLRTCFCRYIS